MHLTIPKRNRLPEQAHDWHPGNSEGPDTPGTFLVIPYFAGDQGRPGIERPLGNKAVYYLCPSIAVNGIKGSSTFERGAPMSVTVDISNWGAGTTVAPVQIAVWWSEPATGFTKLNLFGQATVAVPTDGAPRTSPAITNTIPMTARAHICLLARASSVFDAPTAGAPIAPASDRHWAQLNLNAVAAAVGKPFQFVFWAGNPFARTDRFELLARPTPEDALPLLTRQLRTRVALASDVRLAMQDRRGAGGEQSDEGGDRIEIELEPGERRPIVLHGLLPSGTEPGTTVVIEILQLAHGAEEQEEVVVGSIGLVVTTELGR